MSARPTSWYILEGQLLPAVHAGRRGDRPGATHRRVRPDTSATRRRRAGPADEARECQQQGAAQNSKARRLHEALLLHQARWTEEQPRPLQDLVDIDFLFQTERMKCGME
jgi:hypothetical protein